MAQSLVDKAQSWFAAKNPLKDGVGDKNPRTARSAQTQDQADLPLDLSGGVRGAAQQIPPPQGVREAAQQFAPPQGVREAAQQFAPPQGSVVSASRRRRRPSSAAGAASQQMPPLNLEDVADTALLQMSPPQYRQGGAGTAPRLPPPTSAAGSMVGPSRRCRH